MTWYTPDVKRALEIVPCCRRAGPCGAMHKRGGLPGPGRASGLRRMRGA
jgi:hypothetical protein